MATYTVTIATNWYTTSGQIGNSPNSKLPVGYTFESVRESGGRRNKDGTNMWIPSSNCALKVVTPPPVDPPIVPPTEFDRVRMTRTSLDGGLSWSAWTYTGEKDLDG